MEAASRTSVKVSCRQRLVLDQWPCVARIEKRILSAAMLLAGVVATPVPTEKFEAFLKAERGIWRDVIGGLGL
jgi:hypothetical protein